MKNGIASPRLSEALKSIACQDAGWMYTNGRHDAAFPVVRSAPKFTALRTR